MTDNIGQHPSRGSATNSMRPRPSKRWCHRKNTLLHFPCVAGYPEVLDIDNCPCSFDRVHHWLLERVLPCGQCACGSLLWGWIETYLSACSWVLSWATWFLLKIDLRCKFGRVRLLLVQYLRFGTGIGLAMGFTRFINHSKIKFENMRSNLGSQPNTYGLLVRYCRVRCQYRRWSGCQVVSKFVDSVNHDECFLLHGSIVLISTLLRNRDA